MEVSEAPVKEVEKAVAPIVDEVKAFGRIQAAATPGAISKFFGGLWAKVESLDASINTLISKLTSGNSTIAIIIAGLAYWLIKPFISIIVGIPAILIKAILDGAAVIVPCLFQAVPYTLGVIIVLLVITEVINLIKKL